MLMTRMLSGAQGLTYAQTVLQDKPVAFWQLNDTSGTVALDSSGNGYSATYEGSPTLGAAPIANGLGKSASLSAASSQYVTLAAPPAALQLVEGSFEGWWKPSVLPTAANTGGAILATHYSGGDINYMLGFSANDGTGSGSTIDFSRYGGSWQDTVGPQAVVNTPYHVVGTFDGTTSRLYVNGALAASASGTTFTPTANAILMGMGDNGGYLTGLLSNVAIYNTVLSAARILAHYNAGIA